MRCNIKSLSHHATYFNLNHDPGYVRHRRAEALFSLAGAAGGAAARSRRVGFSPCLDMLSPICLALEPFLDPGLIAIFGFTNSIKFPLVWFTKSAPYEWSEKQRYVPKKSALLAGPRSRPNIDLEKVYYEAIRY